ncbi:hypothetical protein [Serratia symbiotica]
MLNKSNIWPARGSDNSPCAVIRSLSFCQNSDIPCPAKVQHHQL